MSEINAFKNCPGHQDHALYCIPCCHETEIESMQSQLAAAKAEIERLNDIGFKTERREQKYIEIMGQYRNENKRLREALANIGNEAGSPIMGYAPEIAKRELENSRLKISVMAKAALDGGRA